MKPYVWIAVVNGSLAIPERWWKSATTTRRHVVCLCNARMIVLARPGPRSGSAQFKSREHLWQRFDFQPPLVKCFAALVGQYRTRVSATRPFFPAHGCFRIQVVEQAPSREGNQMKVFNVEDVPQTGQQSDRTDQPRLLGLWRAAMKNRWICLLLNEAPFPAIVLAQAGVNKLRRGERVLPAFLPIERQIASSYPKRDGFLAINCNYDRQVIEYGQIGTHSDE